MPLAYVIAAAVLVASSICGEAIFRLTGRRQWTWSAPATGFSLLMVVAIAAVQLPGHGVAAAGALAVSVAAALVVLRGRPSVEILRAAPSIAVVLLLASVPFIVNGRVGILGVSIDNDLAPHFAWSDALRTGNDWILSKVLPDYPLGPHGLSAALSTAFGTNASVTLTALMLVTPVLTAVSAFALLPELRLPFQFIGSIAVAGTYLTMGYFAEGSFKEPLMAMLTFVYALVLRDVLRRGHAQETVALGLIAAASVEVYGYPAVVPLVGTSIFGAVAVQLLEWRIPSRALVRGAGVATLVAGAVAIVALLPQAHRIFGFASFEPAGEARANPFGGNLVGPISPWQVFALWPSFDFRIPPMNVFRAGELAAAGALLALYGTLWWLNRRDPVIPAAAASALFIYAYARHAQTEYISAKTLALATVIVAATAVFPLLGEASRATGPLLFRIAHLVAALGFTTGVVWSSIHELRSAEVGPLAHVRELRGLNALVRDEPTVFLGRDDFAAWELLDAKVGYVDYTVPSRVPIDFRAGEAPRVGAPLDFDSVTPHGLDRYKYAITTRTGYSSVPPPNWREVERGRWFVVWKRVGPTPHVRILSTGDGQPGALLDCRSAEGRQLMRRRGYASVRPAPVILPASGWRQADAPAPLDYAGLAVVTPGATLQQTVDLPAGRWEASLQYSSPSDLIVASQRLNEEMPASLDREGPYWHVKDFTTSGGHMRIAITPRHSGIRKRFASVGALAFTRTDSPSSDVPLAKACGRYVDWYVLG